MMEWRGGPVRIVASARQYWCEMYMTSRGLPTAHNMPVILRRKDDDKYYVSWANYSADDKDIGPFDTLDAAKCQAEMFPVGIDIKPKV